ncbi:DNA-formamidopyrimidine glycosylase family protein [Dyadobacter sp. CY323]|uniref:DNA-formamidopyrimidine glycosylase family protein n=1 Tax=Dyadobacter sp. CY323 TaxID=2907302 RepID=UPI001F206A04|nr:DNA-formamidopyrimidine glycosylase family protein [Dyadobacter sp. CY323]MCE6987602.1 endonuclease [Dyadobacter sp. CY323]
MPEGPSIVILKEAIDQLNLEGKVIRHVEGNTKIDKDRLINQKVTDFRSWGKHFLICFDEFTLRIHFLLFGSYLINEQKKTPPRLSLIFDKDELNFYACSVQIFEEPADKIYDWSGDIMSDSWKSANALKKLKANPGMLVCDALLDQNIFAGSGNIIKNEVLFRARIHPLNTVVKLPDKKLKEMVTETRNYAFDFLEWKKEFTLKKHWLAHTKKTCPRCNIPFHKEYLGKTKRRSYFCTNCQVLYE